MLWVICQTEHSLWKQTEQCMDAVLNILRGALTDVTEQCPLDASEF